MIEESKCRITLPDPGVGQAPHRHTCHFDAITLPGTDNNLLLSFQGFILGSFFILVCLPDQNLDLNLDQWGNSL
uniref:Uncharacterized protein n=1 Tax=Rhizophora mucronata TaxID=61149 RepID=A0A2P2N435_RHIMU